MKNDNNISWKPINKKKIRKLIYLMIVAVFLTSVEILFTSIDNKEFYKMGSSLFLLLSSDRSFLGFFISAICLLVTSILVGIYIMRIRSQVYKIEEGMVYVYRKNKVVDTINIQDYCAYSKESIMYGRGITFYKNMNLFSFLSYKSIPITSAAFKDVESVVSKHLYLLEGEALAKNEKKEEIVMFVILALITILMAYMIYTL